MNILSAVLGALVFVWIRIRQKRAARLNADHLMDEFMAGTHTYSAIMRDAGIFVIKADLTPFRIGG